MQLLVLVLFYFELHSQLGNYDTIRTPKQGRDFDYRYSSYDLYLVGATNEIYRFNLKQGQYLESLSSKLMQIFVFDYGHLECYDPHVRSLVGQIDCAVFANSNSVYPLCHV
ncbi:unnamed protein product [Rotaria socialis]